MMRAGISSQRGTHSALPIDTVNSPGYKERKYEKRKGWRFLKRVIRTACLLILSLLFGLIVLALHLDGGSPSSARKRPMTTYQLHQTLEAEFRMLFQDPNHLDHRKYVTWLTKATFDDFVRTHEHVFIDFFSHNCAWSQRMYPIWVEFATEAHHANLSVAVGAVDCVDQEEICARMGVTAFPILKWFVNGTVTVPVYEKKRSAPALLEFAFQHTKKP